MKKTFRIDCFPESALRCREDFAIVAVDVIRATTTAVTAASLGWKCYPAGSAEAALGLARRFRRPLLAGEINGRKPPGFHMDNSPSELAGIRDVSRPLILLSSSGTKLIANALGAEVVYLACFRNTESTADELIRERHTRIALLGAGSRGEFREEDQIACAWIAASLERAGYTPEDSRSALILNRWRNARITDCLVSKSVDFLRTTNQMADLRFILERVNDLDEAFTLAGNGPVTAGPAWSAAKYQWTSRHQLLS